MRTRVLPPKGVQFEVDSPWNSLLDGLRLTGHEILSDGTHEDSYEALISMNHQPLVRQFQMQHSVPPSRTVLIVLEPRVTFPLMYTQRAMRLYGLRYTPSPIWAEALNAKTFLWPQDIGPQEIPEGPYRFRASMINGDKRSAVPGSLYGLRRAVIKASQEQDLPLALFGPGWGASTVAHMMLGAKASLRATIAGTIPSVGEALSLANQRPQSWLGTVDDKQVAFASAPIAIVIENSADYVSEKLIDSIRGGAAPVYVGPPLARFELPESMVLTADPVATSVINAVRSMSVARIDEIRSAGGSWLMSTNAKKHAICEVLTSLGSTIGEQLNRT